MDSVLLTTIIVQAVVYLIVFYILYKKDERDKGLTEEILRNVLSMQREITQTFMEQIAKIEKSHFETNEKQTGKQLAILEENTKHFLDAMTDFTIAMQPKPQPINQISPDLLDKTQIKNTIDKEEPEEHFLDEIQRIPNILDMKIKMEDEGFFKEEIEDE